MLRLVKKITYPIFKIIAAIIIAAFVISWLALVAAALVATPFIPVISPDPLISGYLGFYSGIVSLGIIPLLALVWILFRLLWGYRVRRSVRRGVFGIWLLTLVLFLVTVLFTGRNFIEDYTESKVVVEQVIDKQQPISFKFEPSYRQLQRNDPFHISLDDALIHRNNIRVPDVTLSLLPSESPEIKIVKTVRSAGSNRTNAVENMSYPKHEMQLEDNVLTFGDFYTLGKKDKYRAQCLQYVVHIPVGTPIDLGSGSRLIHRGDFDQHYEYRERRGDGWVMTPEGISKKKTVKI